MSPEDNNVIPLFPDAQDGGVYELPGDGKETEAIEVYTPPQSMEEAVSILQSCVSRVVRARLRAIGETTPNAPGVISIDRYRQDRGFIKSQQTETDIQGLIDTEAQNSVGLFEEESTTEGSSHRFWYSVEGRWEHEIIKYEDFSDGLSNKTSVKLISWAVEGGMLVRETSSPARREPSLRQAQILCERAYRYSTEIIPQVYRYLD